MVAPGFVTGGGVGERAVAIVERGAVHSRARSRECEGLHGQGRKK